MLLILAILLAIAIPTFLGVTKTANDRAVQSNLNTALTSVKSIYQAQGQSFTSSSVTTATLLAASLSSAEPSLGFVAGTSASANQNSISVAVDTATNGGNGIVLAAFSKQTNNCWLVYDNESAVTTGSTNAPWTGAVTGTAGTANSAALTATIVPPSSAGTWYAEIKNTTSGVCMASAPGPAAAPFPAANTYEFQTGSFPNL